ncbi:sigma-70 family RNA polymerase sigma factor [Catelliglobosispora koreensis]|uniref:sigma-70 family RNA polymerase sigma factor n=1 Tax=Catelliglobosispora koreensis TaxID=129052 RepID=UPI0003773CFA|nr:sigma-70 family RNA polymerase sigma factor [Catelliglobosispora koreensis]
MRADLVARCVEVLSEDAERLGELTWAQVVAVTSRRELDAGETSAVFLGLAEAGIEVETPDRDSGNDTLEPAALRSLNSQLPQAMRDHRILTADEEVGFGRRIQLGLRARERLSELSVPDENLVRLASDGDDARNELIRFNVRLVINIARRHLHFAGELDFEDLVQEGFTGLNRAAEKFDPALGYKFSTYATWWIRQSIDRAIANIGHSIRLPVHVWEKVRQIHIHIRDFERRNGRAPALAEIGAALLMDTGHIQGLLDTSAPLVRLDTPIGEAGESSLADYLLVERGPGPEAQVVEQSLMDDLSDALRERLDERSLHVIAMRFGFLDGEAHTLDEIGQVHNVTRERVRQIEGKVLGILASDKRVLGIAQSLGYGLPRPGVPYQRAQLGTARNTVPLPESVTATAGVS